VTMMGTERVDSGWMPNRISAGDSCSLRVPLPDGLGEVAWRLDPSYPADPEGLEIRLLATGRACSGGQPMDDRLSEPQILEQQDKIYLALVAFLPTGDQTCPGNPEEAVVITLSQPVGTRSVVDARTAAGTISDHLPISPCGHIDEAELPTPRPTDGPIALDGPPRRTICG